MVKGKLMKRKYRIISILMITLMVFSSMTVSSFAASKPYVYVCTYQNYAQAQEVLKLINKERSKRGLKKLKLDKALTKAAVQRAAEIGIYVPAKSPHRRPNGKLVKSLNKKICYECCAEGYESPAAVVHGWMTSPPHKRGILLKSAKSVGIGCITTDGGYTYWTLEFSNSKRKKKVPAAGIVPAYKKVVAKSKYLKSSYFRIGDDRGPTMLAMMPEIELGKATAFSPYYQGKWNLNCEARLAPTDFVWSSSNPAVAVVNEAGLVTPIAAGSFQLTAKMKRSPGCTATCVITVYDPNSYEEWY